MMRGFAVVLLVTLLLTRVSQAGIFFSLDPASTAIDGNITPDDILTPGPTVYIQGTSLGLQDDVFGVGGLFDNLNALSFGRDPVSDPLYFSVDRVAVGLPGSDVEAEAQPGMEEAAGDVFRALPPSNSNQLVTDQRVLGLTGGFFGDDLDALALLGGSSVYFSIDALSASINGSVRPGDIFVNHLLSKFAEFGQMGLDFDDDLDGLILNDTYEPGVLNPGVDRALFSLSSFSPSAFTFSGNTYDPGVKGQLSPADILFTDFTGKFSLWASASELGLRPDDELNALATVPEPASVVIFVFLFVSLAITCGIRPRVPAS